MRKSWKVIRRRQAWAGPPGPNELEKVLAEIPERMLAEISCEAFHRLLHRRGDAWFVVSPEGERFQMERPATIWDLVEEMRPVRRPQAVRS